MTTMSWFLRRPNRSDAALRLFCFPYAGAGAVVYHSWLDAFGPDVDVCAVDPPGRLSRRNEPLIQSLPEFIEQLDAATVTLLDRPFVLFGYSLGAMIAFEWARSLRRKGQPQPACLIAAASSAPHQMRKGRALSQLPANELTQALERRYAPMDPKVKQDPEMLDMILRVMRSDLQIMESYNYAPEEPLSCPVLAIGGTRDTIVASDALDAWREQSSAATRVERLEGDHFFLRTQGAALRAIVRSAIQPFALQRRCGGQG